MSFQPSAEDAAAWQRRLASMAKNRAWTLAEASSRTAEEDEEMLQAAHAAQLVAHVYALLKLPGPARHFLRQSLPCFLERDCALGAGAGGCGGARHPGVHAARDPAAAQRAGGLTCHRALPP